MKYILTAFLFLLVLSNSSAQSDSLKKDSSKVIHRDIQFKGPGTLSEFINTNISKDLKKYIYNCSIKGNHPIRCVIDTTGKPQNIKFLTDLPKRVKNELTTIINKAEWEPAISEGKPVNRLVMIPIYF